VQGGEWKANAYVVRSRLDLFSNFTYLLTTRPTTRPRPPASTATSSSRASAARSPAARSSRRWDTPIGGRDGSTTVGVQVRHDRLDPVGLYSTEARTPRRHHPGKPVRQSSVGAYGPRTTRSGCRGCAASLGLRTDHYDFDVDSSIAQNSGTRSATLTSPKLSLVFGPWSKTEYFVNAGYGFHSNDARGTVPRSPRAACSPTRPRRRWCARAARNWACAPRSCPGLQSSLALWQLRSVRTGVRRRRRRDRTQPRQPPLGHRVEQPLAAPVAATRCRPGASKARFTQDDPAGNFVPGRVGKVLSVGATVTQNGPWFGQLQLRYFGPRPLVEDNSQRSASTTLAYCASATA
jgi:hypothetical protein